MSNLKKEHASPLFPIDICKYTFLVECWCITLENSDLVTGFGPCVGTVKVGLQTHHRCNVHAISSPHPTTCNIVYKKVFSKAKIKQLLPSLYILYILSLFDYFLLDHYYIFLQLFVCLFLS